MQPPREEPTRLQEDQSEPDDEPDRVYEWQFEKKVEKELEERDGRADDAR